MGKETHKLERRKAARASNAKPKRDSSKLETSPKKTLIRKTAQTPADGSRESKQAKLIALLQRPSSATIADLMKATDWQAHSVRGVMSGALKKRLGLTITSVTGDSGRVYRIVPSDKAA